MSFCVGDLVECVDDSGINGAGLVSSPVLGHVYTVRDIEQLSDGDGLRLQEIVNPEGLYRDGLTPVFAEPLFDCGRFRPIRKTSIEWAREIVANPKKKIREDA